MNICTKQCWYTSAIFHLLQEAASIYTPGLNANKKKKLRPVMRFDLLISRQNYLKKNEWMYSTEWVGACRAGHVQRKLSGRPIFNNWWLITPPHSLVQSPLCSEVWLCLIRNYAHLANQWLPASLFRSIYSPRIFIFSVSSKMMHTKKEWWWESYFCLSP